ncbi:MAG: LUD domain-containing protein [Acidobacteriota bacterium]|nr:LUD domain-containing protein [Acidobacteriota bacterium]
MNAAKKEILAKIRSAAGDTAEAAPVPREYIQSGAVDLEGFIEKLHDYNAGVYRCAARGLDAAILQAMDARGKGRLVIPAGLPEGERFIRDEGLSYEDLDRSEGVLTRCTVAISKTGTIVLCHTPGEGRRALTLIPDYHLCIVRADQVVETVPEGIRRLREFRTHPITTISGPSATADIEMTRIKGVHGPRTLDVILVS